MEQKTNKAYKDTVFRDLFGFDEKANERFISLYNALHNTNYDSSCEVKPLDIEQVMYMNFANDLARLVDNKIIILAEHQSTINENMPLRCLQYIGRIYEQIQEPKDKYMRKLVEIPTPEFFVFYNGKEDYPVEKTLKLSDSFMVKNKETQLELTVKVININHNKNNEILKKCKTLNEYSTFVETVTRCVAKDSKNGFEKAIKECINNGVLKEYLTRKSKEVNNMLMTEYDYATDIAVQKQEAMLAGEARGKLEGKLDDAKKMKLENISIELIEKITGLPIDQIKNL